MSDMLNWAEKEIKLACERERCSSDERTDCEYGIACYESALKAFKCLLEDEHSGFSIGVTMNALNRLVDGKPLTSIEDSPDVWNLIRTYDDGSPAEYQCSRMSSLFKRVHWDGSVTYSDVDRVVVTYADNPGIRWHNGNATKIVNEMFPITMPYWPPKGRYEVRGEDFLVDPANGDYDTVGYYYVIDPSGQRHEINRYFKEVENGWVEITHEEYVERAARQIDQT